MTTGEPSRRHFITASAMALGAWMTSSAAMGGQAGAGDCTESLEEALRHFTTGIRRTVAPDGSVELICRMPDAFAFGCATSNLAGLGYQARASGNRITLNHQGRTVQLVLLQQQGA